jgi:hypothetical protein
VSVRPSAWISAIHNKFFIKFVDTLRFWFKLDENKTFLPEDLQRFITMKVKGIFSSTLSDFRNSIAFSVGSQASLLWPSGKILWSIGGIILTGDD